MIAGPGPRMPRALRRPGALLLAGGAGLLAVLVLTAAGPGLAGFDPGHIDPARRLLPPGSLGHRLGTDQLGRDVLARTLAGFRWSLPVGLAASLIAAVVGTTAGVAGRDRRRLREALSRLADTTIGFPGLVLAVALIAVAGHGFWALVIVLGLVSWVSFAQTVDRREQARAAPVAVAAFVFADLLVAEASLSFLGIGAPPGTPSWGGMLADARQYGLSAPWMLYAPAAAVVLAVTTANLLGDGLEQLVGAPPAPGPVPALDHEMSELQTAG